MWATTLWECGWPVVQWGAVLAVSLAAAVSDAKTRRIPNVLTGVALVGGVAASCCWGGLGGLADSLAACVILATPYVLLFALAGGGAGDAKLMGALGAWLGMVNGLIVLMAVSLAAIVIGLGVAAARGKLRVVSGNILRALLSVVFMAVARSTSGRKALAGGQSGLTLPYAVVVLAGTCLAAAGVTVWRLH